MARQSRISRWRIVLRAWPPAGAIFVILSFLVTAFWLGHAATHDPGELGWLEPLAAFLAGTGAFILAAILIFRRVDSARAEADSYGLARGLATGYYFNFIRPLVSVLSDETHPLHAEVAERGQHQLKGLVVGLPQAIDDFDPGRHEKLLKELGEGSSTPFELVDIKVNIEGRPRPVWAKLALSQKNSAAVLIDIPTTLSVIGDFARFLAEKELGDSPISDDAMTAAREAIVAASQTDEFGDVLSEFTNVVAKAGSMEEREMSPSTYVHLVPLKCLQRRLEELTEH